MMRLWGGALKELDLSCTEISGEGISSACPQLLKLSLFRCESLTVPGLDNMLRLWGGALIELDLTYTEISGEVIQSIQARYPHVKVKGCRIDILIQY